MEIPTQKMELLFWYILGSLPMASEIFVVWIHEFSWKKVADANPAKIAWKVDGKLTPGTPKTHGGGERWWEWPPFQWDDFCLPAVEFQGVMDSKKSS